MTKKNLTFWPECFKLDKAVTHGPVAQLGERCVRIAEVKGSNPSRSTRKGREIVDFTTFFQLISDIFGSVFVTYLSSTMIFLHFSQRYAVTL